MAENKVEIPIGLDINKNIMLERYRIDPTSTMTEPPVYCRIGDSPTMTAGNFSLINGKAKSGKTFFLGSVVASMVNNDIMLGSIKGSLPNDKRTILYFDTEQSTFHATRTIKRICKLTNSNNPKNLIAYGLRPLTPAERLTAIEDAITTIENLGAVAIDGVRDLLTMGINDEQEATSLTSKFLKWTSDYNIHMILLLHQNKTDQNARGHIGTELLNKAETTLSISKDTKSSIFIVSCEYSRDIAFEDFGFILNEGVILSSEMPGQEQVKTKNPKVISDQIHFEVLDKIFKTDAQYNYSGFQDAIIYGFDNSFGKTVSRAFITHYLERKWINNERSGQKTFYIYNRAKF
jgi:hypothetical protein